MTNRTELDKLTDMLISTTDPNTKAALYDLIMELKSPEDTWTANAKMRSTN